MEDYRKRFQELLRRLFQFESADLDFGIYRIMNFKRGVIEKFIEKDLIKAVSAELDTGALAEQSDVVEQIKEVAEQIRENLGDDAIDGDGNLAAKYHDTKAGRKYLALQAKARGAQARPAVEAAVFNHLYSFFSRYYDAGDFISKRKYSERRNFYAVPYNGEEVYLHWANKDQYYVKTGEHFTDYSFRAPNGVTVHFKLKAASVEKDNVKGSSRFFIALAKEAAFDPKARTIVIPFEYRPLTEQEGVKYGQKNQQDAILAEAQEAVPNQLKKHNDALAALLAPHHQTTDGAEVNFLAHHLRQYTQRNTSDFFVHKKLKAFLVRELYFYLKNEVLALDEMETGGETRAEGWFQIMRAMRAIGGRIIDFLAQIEDFQKILFEKKKLITETQYCITVGNIAESFYPEIAACEAQWDEWKELFHIDEEQRNLFNSGAKTRKDRRLTFLKDHPTLVLDTKHFDQDFRDRLLATFDDLDEMTDGLLIHSDNFQALNLLREKYRQTVNCVYIDPPYNTDASPILYKNGYKSSTWASLMENRLRAVRPLMAADGVLVAAIDDEQQRELNFILSDTFEGRLLGTISVRANPSGRPTKTGYSVAHEYLLIAGQGPASAIGRMPPTEDQMARFSESDERGPFEWRNLRREGSNSDRAARRALYYPIYIKGTGIRVPRMEWDKTAEEWKVLEKPGRAEQVVYPDNEEGVQKTWRWEWATVMESIADLSVRPDRSGRDYVYYKRRPHEDGVVSMSCWFDAKYSATEHGTAVIKALFGRSVFSYPKSIHAVVDSIYVSGGAKADAHVLDYFAGSGTSAHAVINLNRQDGGHRKSVAVEVETYFDAVLLPRIKKVTFSPEWKDGKPVRQATAEEAERSPRIVKYIRLESYEDALNNISFTGAPQTLYDLNDYMLRYMLEWETKESPTLLNVQQLTSPFNYKLLIADGQETRERVVDIPETFAYLLGMHVTKRLCLADRDRPYVVYRGRIDHRQVVVIWRDTTGWEKKDYERDKAFAAEQKLTEGADDVFVNGDSVIAGARSLDPVFKGRMFAPLTANGGN